MKYRLPYIIVSAILLLCGCTGPMGPIPAFRHFGQNWQADRIKEITACAGNLETKGELAMALEQWRLIRQIDRQNEKADFEIDRLSKTIAENAGKQFDAGMACLKRKERFAARNHFLTALRLDPTFEPALQLIRTRFSSFPLIIYKTDPGDYPALVAQKVFRDDKKAFLVTWFNDLPQIDEIPTGTMLILPKINKASPKKAFGKKTTGPPLDSHEQTVENHQQTEIMVLASAKKHFDQGHYQQSLALLETLLEDIPDCVEARALATEARYRSALFHMDHERIPEARSVLAKMEDGNAAGAALKDTIQARLEKKARLYYRSGVKHFIDEDLNAAIVDWEKTLSCIPDHPRALENIENARRLLKKVEALP